MTHISMTHICLAICDIKFKELHQSLEKLQQMVHDFQRLLQDEETNSLTCAHLLYHFGLVRSVTNLIRRPGRTLTNDQLLQINEQEHNQRPNWWTDYFLFTKKVRCMQ